MTLDMLPGLPLQEALALYDGEGLPRPEVRYTAAPRRAIVAGEPRVLAVRNGGRLLIASIFPPDPLIPFAT